MHLIFEAVVETDNDAEVIHRALVSAIEAHGKAIVLVWQTNRTDEEVSR